MTNIKAWLESLFFSDPVYFTFFYFLATLVIVFVVILLLKLKRPKKTKYSRYQLLVKDAGLIAVLVLCGVSIVALAGPKNRTYKLITGGNVDLIIVVDNSYSTTEANDVSGKTRLETIKTIIAGMLDSKNGNNLFRPGDRITLFAFGTHSIWQLPLSEDLDDFNSKLVSVTTVPKVYWDDSRLSTDMAKVLEHIPESMDRQDNFFKRNAGNFKVSWVQHNRVTFLFSDGDDREGIDIKRGVDELKKRNIKVFPVGVGTRAGQEVTVKTYDPGGSDKPVRKTRRTTLQMELLNEIAAKTGGESYIVDEVSRISDAQSFLKSAADDNRSLTPRLVPSEEGRDVWWEILAIPGIVLLGFMIKWS